MKWVVRLPTELPNYQLPVPQVQMSMDIADPSNTAQLPAVGALPGNGVGWGNRDICGDSISSFYDAILAAGLAPNLVPASSTAGILCSLQGRTKVGAGGSAPA